MVLKHWFFGCVSVVVVALSVVSVNCFVFEADVVVIFMTDVVADEVDIEVVVVVVSLVVVVDAYVNVEALIVVEVVIAGFVLVDEVVLFEVR